jgi:uncharacterized protein (TIGR03437 family)
MRKFAACVFLVFPGLLAQTSDTTFFRAILLPSNEVPALNNNSRGIADVIASAVRDSSGTIVSGTIDVLLRTTLPAANTVTGLNLHNGIGSQVAPVALSTGLSASNNRPLQTGADFIHIPIQIADPVSAAQLRTLLDDPAHFYLNVTSTDQPTGLMRGQLQRAQGFVAMGLFDSANVTKEPVAGGHGFAQVVAIGTRDAGGNWTSGEVYSWATVHSDDPTAFNGFHIHTGDPGNDGAIGIASPLPPGAIADPFGDAQLGPLYTEIAVNNAAQLGAFNGLFANPNALYIDLHTVQNPSGLVRAQLRPTDRATFPLLLSSANEVATPGASAAMPMNLTVYTLRNEDGTVAAATMLCDLNLRLAAATQILGLYIHDAPARNDGPISIKVTADFSSDTGFGNYYGWTAPLARLDAVQDLLDNPESHYANLHTFDSVSGAARAQLGVTVPPAAVGAVLAANLDTHATTMVPGGLATIFGAALNKVPADLSGWRGSQLPFALNGTRVSIAGKTAPLIYVSPNQINLQVPIDAPTGVQTLTVDNGAGPGTAFSINIANAAPAIFFSPTAAVLKNANFSLVGPANPAHAGDVLLVYLTGLGQTTPPLATGRLVPAASLPATRPVTATIGGRAATVVYSAASPGFTGLYQVAVTVPAGVTGSLPLQLQMGGATSNAVTIPVQ